MIYPFQIIGPSENPYPGTSCLLQVPIPSGMRVNVYDEATIQVIETTVEGSSLYNVSQPLSNFLLSSMVFLHYLG